MNRTNERAAWVFLAVLMLMAALLLAGCQTDQQRLNAAEVAFASTVRTLVALDDAGKIDEDWKPQIRAARLTTYEAIKSLRAELDAGGAIDARASLRAIEAGLAELLAYQTKAEAR